MKPSQTRLPDASRQRSEAEAALEKHVAELFRRMPMLCGFSMRENLEIDDVAVFTWPGHTVGAELYKDLIQTLADLAEERPDAVKLLRGRTFARAIH